MADPIRTFLITYQHMGYSYDVEFKATSYADACQRLDQIKKNGEVTAEVMAEVNADRHLFTKIFPNRRGKNNEDQST